MRIDNLGKYAKKGIKGKETAHWQGGRIIAGGYYYVYAPNHPNKTLGCYVLEHRLIMEKHIKRYLKKEEIVHHGNGNKLDNRFGNLCLVENQSEHNKIYHNRQRDKLGRFISGGAVQ